MERKETYPNFKEWKKIAFHTRTGLCFAPEDFYIIKEDYRRKSYFSKAEAFELEESVMKPNGWRLPTRDEWLRVMQELGDIEGVREVLRLGINGYIKWQDVEKYDSNPSMVAPVCFGSMSYYWSSTISPDTKLNLLRLTNTEALLVSEHRYTERFSIRCVRDE